jgi:lipase
MVADVVDLLEALADQGGEAPILVGHSMGAGVAGSVLATRPDLVRAGVLEDPPWSEGPRDARSASAGQTIQQSVQPFRDDCEAAMVRGRVDLPRWPEVEFRPWAQSKAQLDPSPTDRGQIAGPSPWIDIAAAITRPTLLVTGGREGAILLTAQSRKRLSELSNDHIEVQVVPGAGHTVRRDCARAYHQIVDPWVRMQFSTQES